MVSEAAIAVRAALGCFPRASAGSWSSPTRGLTCREAAKAAGIPEGTAKSRLRLALARLETVLDRQLLEPS